MPLLLGLNGSSIARPTHTLHLYCGSTQKNDYHSVIGLIASNCHKLTAAAASFSSGVEAVVLLRNLFSHLSVFNTHCFRLITYDSYWKWQWRLQLNENVV